MPSTFNNANLKLSTTATTALYQAPTATSATSIVLSILVANVDGTNSADITVSKQTSGDSEQSKIAFTIPVGPDSSLELIPNKLVLLAGEKLKATASSANTLEITLSALEITV